jgi:hypothetical protein
MTTTKWIIVEKKWCELIGQEASIMEQRVYAADMLPDTEPFRVIARKCSANFACNLADVPCHWAFTNPQVDRFQLG